MSRSQAIAILLMAACVVLAAAKPTLRPMSDEQQGEAKIAGAEDDNYGYYPRLEHETVCLKATEFEMTAEDVSCFYSLIIDPDSGLVTGLRENCVLDSFQFDSQVACCNGIPTNGNNYYPDDDEEMDMNAAPPVVIGSCTTTVLPRFSDGSAFPKKVATFNTYCSVPHGSLCGAPFCDDLYLVQEGYVVQGEAVAKYDPRTKTPVGWDYQYLPVMAYDVDDENIIGPRNTTRRVIKKATKKAIERVKVMAAAETEGYGYGGDSYGGSNTPPSATTEWFKGIVEVYSGPVTIFSKKHAFKYHVGHREFVMWAGNTTKVESKGKLPVVNPWTYTLKMNKPQGY